MVNNKYFIVVLFFLILTGTLSAQRGDPNLRRIGYHTGNRVGISFYNDGQISGFNTGIDIRGEWPLGSGENYIGDCVPLIGVEFISDLGDTLHSVCISRGPRRGQGDERHPDFGYFWGWNPLPGYLNPNAESVAMSHLPESWPIGGWRDEPNWVDENGNTVWNGYFGRGVQNADQESYYWADDQADDEFNANFLPDSTDATRKGMGLQMSVRGFQWSSFLAEDVIFWLYDITNDATYTYRKACFGTVVGTLAGGDGDSQDDLGFFDVDEWITYSWDSDGVGNKGQKVGYVGYAFLESPGNPFDGIDNDDDSPNPNAPTFLEEDFDSVTYDAGDVIVLIDPGTYVRTQYTVQAGTNTVTSLGVTFTFDAGVTYFREGHIARIENGVSIPHPSAYDGIDNDLDGIIDENMAIHYETRIRNGLEGLRHKDFIQGLALDDPLIDEERDNDAGGMITSWQYVGTDVQQVTHYEGDEDADWVAVDELGILVDDVGSDGLGPWEDLYTGPDPDGTEGNGIPDQGEPNFGKTDPNESDQIGLTSFNFFELGSAPDLSQDEILWSRMFPGRFDVIPPNPQDGDFIYASGYFPLPPDQIERFSVALLFGEDLADIVRNKQIVQQIYDAGYKFPQPPKKPVINITQEDGKVVIYWDGAPPENSIDFISKEKDFEGYKIYRSTDAGFIDARSITNAYGVLSFDKPIAQYDIKGNGIGGFFYPSPELLGQLGGTTFYLGDDTTGVVNRFVDSTVMKGQTYYYAVTSYDKGDALNNIFPAENSIFIFRDNSGRIITDDNTGYITPGARPVGYVPAVIDSLQKSQNFRGTGFAEIEIIDDEAINDQHSYEISFTDTSVQGYTSSWSLKNTTTNTLLVDSSTTFFGSTPIVEGFKVQIYNDNTIKIDTLNSGFDVTPSADFQNVTVQPWFWSATGTGAQYNGIPVPYDYEIEFFSSNVGNSVADTLFPPNNRLPSQPINFKVMNVTTGQEVPVVYFVNQGTLSTTYNFYLKEQIGDTVYRTWRFSFFYTAPNVPLEQTGKYKLVTKKPFSANDMFTFTVSGAEIDNQKVENQKDMIKVVPNPYVVTHEAEARLLSNQTSGRGEREIRFTHIPPGSKISIFTVRGDLIKTLYHDGTYVGDVYWNLRTEENIDVAFGVYVYVVELPGAGEKIGKFALIK